MPEVQLALLALQMLEKLAPVIQQQFQSGVITAEQQQAVRDQYTKLMENLDTVFSGPEWEVKK